MANLVYGGFGAGGGGFEAGDLSSLQARRLQELLFRRQQEESNEATQRGYEAIGGRGGEAIGTPAALGTKSVGFGQYVDRLNRDTELQNLMRQRGGEAPLSRNPIARSATPGPGFVAPPAQGPGVQGGPYREAGGQRPGPAPAQAQRSSQPRYPSGAYQPPSQLGQVMTAQEQIGTGAAAEQAGFGAGSAMIRQALQGLAGYQKPLMMPGQPPLASLAPGPRPGAYLDTGDANAVQAGYAGQAVDRAAQARAVQEAGPEDPRVTAARIAAEGGVKEAQISAEAEPPPATFEQERALALIRAIPGMTDDLGALTPQAIAMLKAAGIDVPASGGGGATSLVEDPPGSGNFVRR